MFREYRNFFAFDLSALSGVAVSATLSISGAGLGNSYYNPSGDSLAYTNYQIRSPLETVLTGGSGLTDIFEDLGSGTRYGSTNVSTPGSSGPMPAVQVDLTGALQDLTRSFGEKWGLGGAVTRSGNVNQTLWANSEGSQVTLRVETTSEYPGCGPSGGVPPKCNPPVIPLPATLPLLFGGLGLLTLAFRRRYENEVNIAR